MKFQMKDVSSQVSIEVSSAVEEQCCCCSCSCSCGACACACAVAT